MFSFGLMLLCLWWTAWLCLSTIHWDNNWFLHKHNFINLKSLISPNEYISENVKAMNVCSPVNIQSDQNKDSSSLKRKSLKVYACFHRSYISTFYNKIDAYILLCCNCSLSWFHIIYDFLKKVFYTFFSFFFKFKFVDGLSLTLSV